MFGSSTFKWVHGDWEHVGWLGTQNIPVALSVQNGFDGTPIIPRGTFLDYNSDGSDTAVLGSGNYCGLMTQDLNLYGTTNAAGYKAFSIGQFDLPVKQPRPISLRVPRPGGIAEFEGLGLAVPGNLVCTSGTGALSTATARGLELSVLNGAIRLAQSGDLVIGTMEFANCTPEKLGNLRIRVKFSAPCIKG